MSRKTILTIVGLAALCLLGFVVRLAPYKEVFSPTPYADGSRISLFGVDPYFRTRRIMLSMETFPRVQYSDPYLGYPGRGQNFLAPIFDQVCVGAAKALGYTAEDQEPLLRFLVFIPPLMGALTLPFVYLLARRMMNNASAWVSTGIFAVMPGHVSYSILSRIDHHVAEMLTVVLMFLVFVALLEKIEKIQRIPFWHVIGLGGTIACALATSVTSLILIALIPGFVLIMATARIAKAEGGDFAPLLSRSIWIAFLIAAFPLAPFCARPPWLGPFHEIHIGLSWSYLYVIWLMALVGLVMDYACRIVALQGDIKKAAVLPLVAIGVTALGVAVPALVFPSLLAPLNIAGTLFTRIDVWHELISEAQPLFSERGEFHPLYAEAMLTWFVYLYPLVVAILLVARFRAKERPVAFDFFLFLLVTVGALGFSRKRLIYFLALSVSLCVSYFLVGFVRWMWKTEWEGRKAEGERRKLRSLFFRVAGIVGIAAVCALAYYPSLNFFWPLSGQRHAQARPFFTSPRAMRDTFAWMSHHTPPTSFYLDPTRNPEYGVIFNPDYSLWLLFYARRPVVGAIWGVFRYDGNDRALDVFRFFVAESEAEANEICDRDCARYIVTYPILFFVRDYAAIVGADPDRYMVLTRKEDTGKLVSRPTERYWHLIGQRLHECDGVGPEDAAPPSLQRYRLLYESESFPYPDTGKPSVLKVFEYVKGARITGLTMPLARVKAEVAMVTNQNRQFTYRNSVVADDQGRFTLIVPYATSGKPGETHALSRYRVNSLAVDAFADVTEEDILGGGEVRVVFPGRRP